MVRADMKKSDLPDSVDQFTISIEPDPDVTGGGLIKSNGKDKARRGVCVGEIRNSKGSKKFKGVGFL